MSTASPYTARYVEIGLQVNVTWFSDDSATVVAIDGDVVTLDTYLGEIEATVADLVNFDDEPYLGVKAA